MTPFSSVAILEKLALFRIAFCKAPVLSKVSWRRTSAILAAMPARGSRTAGSRVSSDMADQAQGTKPPASPGRRGSGGGIRRPDHPREETRHLRADREGDLGRHG